MNSMPAVLDRKIRASRAAFLQDIEGLPAPYNRIAVNHYTLRTKEAGDTYRIGEMAPWLFADALGNKQIEKYTEFVAAWLHIYTYILLTDDVIDRSQLKNKEMLLISAGLLLERGVVKMAGLSPKTNLIQVVDSFLSETAIAAAAEHRENRRWNRTLKPSSIRDVGKKLSALKICAKYIQDAYDEETNDIERAAELLSTGIQLLDDVTDWEEDLREKNYTYLIADTLQRMRKDKYVDSSTAPAVSRNEILLGMVVTGSLADYVNESSRSIWDAIKLLHRMDDTYTLKYLHTIIEANSSFIETLREIKDGIDRSSLSVQYSLGWFGKYARTADGRRNIKKISKAIPLVAQSS